MNCRRIHQDPRRKDGKREVTRQRSASNHKVDRNHQPCCKSAGRKRKAKARKTGFYQVDYQRISTVRILAEENRNRGPLE